jgi:hypothetical protein
VKPNLRALSQAMHFIRIASTGWALLSVSLTFAGRVYARASPVIPVLSVCETLRSFKLYRGRTVVIVARSEMTFEGSFMDERCETDARILIQGHRWLSMIELFSDSDTATQSGAFPVDETLLRAKMTEVKSHADPVQQDQRLAAATVGVQAGDSRDTWVAVYGQIECPARLKPHIPPSGAHYHNIAGNGYGSNGSVPARITAIRLVTLVQGQDPLEFIAPRAPTQREQPPLELSEPPRLSMPLAVPALPPGLPIVVPGPPA